MAFLKALALSLSLMAALAAAQTEEDDTETTSTTPTDTWEIIWDARSAASHFVGADLPNMHLAHPVMNDTSPPYSLPLAASSASPHCLIACLSPLQLTGATNCSAAYMTEDCACLVAPAAAQAAITRCVSALCPSAPPSSFSFIGVSGSDPTLAANIALATSLFSSYCQKAYGAYTMASAYNADSARGGMSYTGTVVTPTATAASDAGAGGMTGLPTAPAPASTTAGVPDAGTGVGTGAGPLTPTLEIPVDPVTGPAGPADTAEPNGPATDDVATPSVVPFAGPASGAWGGRTDELGFNPLFYTMLVFASLMVIRSALY